MPSSSSRRFFSRSSCVHRCGTIMDVLQQSTRGSLLLLSRAKHRMTSRSLSRKSRESWRRSGPARTRTRRAAQGLVPPSTGPHHQAPHQARQRRRSRPNGFSSSARIWNKNGGRPSASRKPSQTRGSRRRRGAGRKESPLRTSRGRADSVCRGARLSQNTTRTIIGTA